MGSMDAERLPRSEMAQRLRLSRNTVARHAYMEEISPSSPVPGAVREVCARDEAGLVQPVLEVDLGAPHKQPHDAWMLDWRQLKHVGSLPSRRIGSDIEKPSHLAPLRIMGGFCT